MKQLIALLLAVSSSFAQYTVPQHTGATAAAGGGGGGIALVAGQTATCTSVSTPYTCVLPNPPTSGNYLYIAIYDEWFGTNPGVSSVVCTGTSGWAQIPSAFVSFSGAVGTNATIWRGAVGGGASATCTITIASGNSSSGVVLAEFTGLSGSNDATTPVSNQNNSTTSSTGTFSNTTATSLILGVSSSNNGVAPSASPGSPWTKLGAIADASNGFAIEMDYKVETIAEAQSASWTVAGSSVNWVTLIAGQH